MKSNIVLIDTLEVRVAHELLVEKRLLCYAKYISSVVIDRTLYARFKINPNKYAMKGKYVRTESLEQVLIVLSEFVKELNIDITDISIFRIDIAADFNNSYKEDFKLWLYIFELLTIGKVGSKWYNINLDTYRPNNIRYKGNKLAIAFYDKEDESKGKDIYKSRLELRYSKIENSDINKIFKKYKKNIKSIDKNVAATEKHIANKLFKLYKEDGYKTLSEFVRVNNSYIATKGVLRQLHSSIGLEGNIETWVKGYQRTNKLKFIKKAEVKAVRKKILDGLKLYENIIENL